MRFAQVVAASAAVSGTRSRRAKVETLAAVLHALAPAEVEPAVAWLAGEPRQGRMSWPVIEGSARLTESGAVPYHLRSPDQLGECAWRWWVTG